VLEQPAATSLPSVGSVPRLRAYLKTALEVLLPALVLAWLVRSFLFAGIFIPSSSMEPTLLVGDRLFMNRFLYGAEIPFTGGWRLPALRQPRVGDVVVFRYPLDPSQDYIKRVVGVEGDVLSMRAKQLYRNGEAVHESWAQNLEPGIIRSTRDEWGPMVVPEGMLFMMGDNRDRSADSRYWGFLDRSLVKGKAEILYWSWDAEHFRPRWGRILHLVP